MTDKIVVLSTCPSREEAERLARALVESRMAACVNIVPGVQSIYQWKGEIAVSDEVMLVIKSRRDLSAGLMEQLAQMHSYEVPEAIAIPVVDGLPAYLEWLDREVQSPENS